MSVAAVITLGLWLGATVLAGWLWLPARIGPWPATRESRRGRIVVLAVLVLLVGASAILASAAAPLVGPWRWVGVVLGGAVVVLGGGAVTTCVLGLASAAAPTTARVQRDVLRGGAWIGALERLALLGTLLAGRPEGLAAIIAVKGLARYPELRTLSGADGSRRALHHRDLREPGLGRRMRLGADRPALTSLPRSPVLIALARVPFLLIAPGFGRSPHIRTPIPHIPGPYLARPTRLCLASTPSASPRRPRSLPHKGPGHD